MHKLKRFLTLKTALLVGTGVGVAMLLGAQGGHAQLAGFSYQWVGQTYDVPTTPATEGSLTIRIRNTGRETWDRTNPATSPRLATRFDQASPLAHSSWLSTNRVGSFTGRVTGGGIDHGATTIAPGETAIYEFAVRTPDHPVQGQDRFSFVIDGRGWLNDAGIWWPVDFPQGFAAQWAGQSAFPTLASGGSGSLSFDYQNTGRYDWIQGGPVRLAPTGPRDRASALRGDGWLAANRVGGFSGRVSGTTVDSSVQVIHPGETARFTVPLSAAAVSAGTYRERFSLVADGFAWLQDYGAYQDVTVGAVSPPPSQPSQPTDPAPGGPILPNLTGNPFGTNDFYIEPNSPAAQQAAAWRNSRPADAAHMDKIAGKPHAIWLGNWSGDITQSVGSMLGGIPASQVPVFVAYNIPARDCGSYSAGGSASAEAYRNWINGLAAGIGSRKAAVILEPDALAMLDCLDAAGRTSRLDLLKYAVTKLGSNPSTAVYLDAGHSNWHSPAEMASRLTQAGVAQARGFSTNVSNYNATLNEVTYGTAVSALTGGKKFVIDTSRNGNGPGDTWCNPSGRALGQAPSTATGNPLIDAYLWVKVPGESDGTCGGGPSAGQWWSDYALGLAQRAAY